MSLALDANLLLYASDESSRYHGRARAFLERLVGGSEIVYVFWPTVTAYLRIATHPSIFEQPLELEVAAANVERLLALPHVQTAGEGDRFWQAFRRIATEADARGNLLPDAQLVALMAENGVRTIWTHDRDFRRFPDVEVRDPFEEPAP